MKKLVILGFLLSINLSTFGQKVIYKKGVIYKDGKKYALMERLGNVLSGYNYSIKTLNGKEVIYVKNRNEIPTLSHFEIIFIESDQRGMLTNNFSFSKTLTKLIVRNDLVGKDGINPEGKKKFLQIYPYEEPKATTQAQVNISTQPNRNSTTPNSNVLNYQTVERNRESDIAVYDEMIQQDFKHIGTIKRDIGLNTTYRVFLPNGMKIAEGRFSDGNVFKLVTLKDNRQHILHLSSYDFESTTKVAQYLSDRYYL